MVTKIVKSTLLGLLAASLPAWGTSATDEGLQQAIRLAVERLASAPAPPDQDGGISDAGLLVEFYERRRFLPAWTEPGRIRELISAIEASEAHGLSPADYGLAEVREGYARRGGGDSLPLAVQAAMDLRFTESLLRLDRHHRYGKLDPVTVDPGWTRLNTPSLAERAGMIEQALAAASMPEYFESAIVRPPAYRRLREALLYYRRLAADGGWRAVPPGPTLRPGDTGERLPILRQRLAITGDLPNAPAAAPDYRYDTALEAAVRRIQERHGLEVDGLVGPATLGALNVSAEDRVRQLEANLERLRWIAGDTADEFLLVNLAAFEAYLIRDWKIAWQARVQIGTTEDRSPVFRDQMRYLVFNPTWSVPYRIASEELLPEIQADPDYLSAKRIEVRHPDETPADPAAIDWSGLAPGNFPYTLVQQPGPQNPMGRVKFMFPNEFGVYLHDTPSKRLFEQAERARSHGCIRLQNPLQLASVLLGRDGWTAQRLEKLLAGGRTTTVFLADPLPVLLTYWTAGVDTDNELRFYPDIYERDEELLRRLTEPSPPAVSGNGSATDAPVPVGSAVPDHDARHEADAARGPEDRPAGDGHVGYSATECSSGNS